MLTELINYIEASFNDDMLEDALIVATYGNEKRQQYISFMFNAYLDDEKIDWDQFKNQLSLTAHRVLASLDGEKMPF